MATRGNRTSLEHVQALNSIPIEFYGKDKKLVEICEHWRKYINHLSTRLRTHKLSFQANAAMIQSLVMEALNERRTFLAERRAVFAA